MERAEVVERVAASLGLDTLAESDTFADKGVDSLAVVELALDLEEAYGVELTEPEVRAAVTVGDLADLVSRHQA